MLPDNGLRFPTCKMGKKCMLKHKSLTFQTKDELKEKKKKKKEKNDPPQLLRARIPF